MRIPAWYKDKGAVRELPTHLCDKCSLKEVFIVCGILGGYLTSYLWVDTVGGWRFMYGVAAAPALILLAGMVRLCHSPLHIIASYCRRSLARSTNLSIGSFLRQAVCAMHGDKIADVVSPLHNQRCP